MDVEQKNQTNLRSPQQLKIYRFLLALNRRTELVFGGQRTAAKLLPSNANAPFASKTHSRFFLVVLPSDAFPPFTYNIVGFAVKSLRDYGKDIRLFVGYSNEIKSEWSFRKTNCDLFDPELTALRRRIFTVENLIFRVRMLCESWAPSCNRPGWQSTICVDASFLQKHFARFHARPSCMADPFAEFSEIPRRLYVTGAQPGS